MHQSGAITPSITPGNTHAAPPWFQKPLPATQLKLTQRPVCRRDADPDFDAETGEAGGQQAGPRPRTFRTLGADAEDSGFGDSGPKRMRRPVKGGSRAEGQLHAPAALEPGPSPPPSPPGWCCCLACPVILPLHAAFSIALGMLASKAAQNLACTCGSESHTASNTPDCSSPRPAAVQQPADASLGLLFFFTAGPHTLQGSQGCRLMPRARTCPLTSASSTRTGAGRLGAGGAPQSA